VIIWQIKKFPNEILDFLDGQSVNYILMNCDVAWSCKVVTNISEESITSIFTSTLKTDAIYSSETFVTTQKSMQWTRKNIIHKKFSFLYGSRSFAARPWTLSWDRWVPYSLHPRSLQDALPFIPQSGPDRDMWAPGQANNIAPLQTNSLYIFVQHLFRRGGEMLFSINVYISPVI
jgi:hypothetical protein